jgi:hypothetical protein
MVVWVIAQAEFKIWHANAKSDMAVFDIHGFNV